MIIVSACLVGMRTRYDGESKVDEKVQELVAQGKAIPLCPEQLGGLPTPRLPATIRGGSGEDVWEGRAVVVDSTGRDLTDAFCRGAMEVLRIAKLVNAEKIILKARSPSCGVHTTSKDFSIAQGCGVCTALLKREGFILEER